MAAKDLRKCWYSQACQEENEAYGNLLRGLHLQFPQVRQREDQECEIGDDIERRGAVVRAGFGRDAFTARDGFVPPVCERAAEEADYEDVDDEPDD